MESVLRVSRWVGMLGRMYPEINVQIAGTAKLPVADLEGDGHLVVGVQLLVEALSRVRLEQDVVRGGNASKGQQACYRW